MKDSLPTPVGALRQRESESLEAKLIEALDARPMVEVTLSE
jgi:hypothetical protein